MAGLYPSRYFISSGMKRTTGTTRKSRTFPPEQVKIVDGAPLVVNDETQPVWVELFDVEVFRKELKVEGALVESLRSAKQHITAKKITLSLILLFFQTCRIKHNDS